MLLVEIAPISISILKLAVKVHTFHTNIVKW